MSIVINVLYNNCSYVMSDGLKTDKKVVSDENFKKFQRLKGNFIIGYTGYAEYALAIVNNFKVYNNDWNLTHPDEIIHKLIDVAKDIEHADNQFACILITGICNNGKLASYSFSTEDYEILDSNSVDGNLIIMSIDNHEGNSSHSVIDDLTDLVVKRSKAIKDINTDKLILGCMETMIKRVSQIDPTVNDVTFSDFIKLR